MKNISMEPTIKISGTAQNVAAYRALESAKAVRERLFNDPYAPRFLPAWQRAIVMLSRAPGVRSWIESYLDSLAPGARTSAIARTRLIDDRLRGDVTAGTRQIVILGAGYDCRAFRLPELAAATVFEVDRPAMVELKAKLLGDERPLARLARVPVDFLKDDLTARLLAAGYDTSLRTTFVWEGVTNYLDAPSVAAVFDFVARSAPSGSGIVFTYVHADAVAGKFEARGLMPLLEALKQRGEPWTFGFQPSELASYLSRHGMLLRSDRSAAEYRSAYWPSIAAEGHGYEFYHVAEAEVADAAR